MKIYKITDQSTRSQYRKWRRVMERSMDKDVECISCDEGDPANECAESEGDCGHHCNHIWTHDECCWCDKNEPIEIEEG